MFSFDSSYLNSVTIYKVIYSDEQSMTKSMKISFHCGLQYLKMCSCFALNIYIRKWIMYLFHFCLHTDQYSTPITLNVGHILNRHIMTWRDYLFYNICHRPSWSFWYIIRSVFIETQQTLLGISSHWPVSLHIFSRNNEADFCCFIWIVDSCVHLYICYCICEIKYVMLKFLYFHNATVVHMLCTKTVKLKHWKCLMLPKYGKPLYLGDSVVFHEWSL